MIKAVALALSLVASLIAYSFASFYTIEVVGVTTEATKVLTWSGLGISEQIRIICGITLEVIMITSAIFIFKSVWIKNGYAGTNRVLEGHEVSLFIAHIICISSFVAFIYFAMWYSYTPVPDYTFYICAAGFVSPEVVSIVNFLLEKYKNKKDGD